MVFLHSHGVGTARAVRIFRTYGVDAVEVMTENPYRLARDIRGIGFKTADAIAMKLGIERTAMIRVRAGIGYALTEAMDEGHCGLPRAELGPLAAKLLEVPDDAIRTALELELAEGAVVADTAADTPCVFLGALYRAERAIAERLQRIAAGRLPWPGIDVERALPWVARKTGLSLAPGQAEAVRLALTSKAVVITGGPGVGKTTIVDAILRDSFAGDDHRDAACAGAPVPSMTVTFSSSSADSVVGLPQPVNASSVRATPAQPPASRRIAAVKTAPLNSGTTGFRSSIATCDAKRISGWSSRLVVRLSHREHGSGKSRGGGLHRTPRRGDEDLSRRAPDGFEVRRFDCPEVRRRGDPTGVGQTRAVRHRPGVPVRRRHPCARAIARGAQGRGLGRRRDGGRDGVRADGARGPRRPGQNRRDHPLRAAARRRHQGEGARRAPLRAKPRHPPVVEPEACRRADEPLARRAHDVVSSVVAANSRNYTASPTTSPARLGQHPGQPKL